jgi:hypothetical protein
VRVVLEASPRFLAHSWRQLMRHVSGHIHLQLPRQLVELPSGEGCKAPLLVKAGLVRVGVSCWPCRI